MYLVAFRREKQTQYQRLQEHLHQTGDLVSRENQVLREFRKELEMLVQERMSHIEELRLIHADINIVRSILGRESSRIGLLLIPRWKRPSNKRRKNDYVHCRTVNVFWKTINQWRSRSTNCETCSIWRSYPTTTQTKLSPWPCSKWFCCLALCFSTVELRSRLISQQATDHDLLPNRSGHQSTLGLDTAHEPFPLGLSFPHSSQSMNSNATSSSMSSFVNHAQQSSTSSMPKMIGNGMTSTLDRSNFRQQPPPMKVRWHASNLTSTILRSFRRVNRVNNRSIATHRSVPFARRRAVRATQKSPNVVIPMFSLEIRISSFSLSLFCLCVCVCTNLSLSLCMIISSLTQ